MLFNGNKREFAHDEREHRDWWDIFTQQYF